MTCDATFIEVSYYIIVKSIAGHLCLTMFMGVVAQWCGIDNGMPQLPQTVLLGDLLCFN